MKEKEKKFKEAPEPWPDYVTVSWPSQPAAFWMDEVTVSGAGSVSGTISVTGSLPGPRPETDPPPLAASHRAATALAAVIPPPPPPPASGAWQAVYGITKETTPGTATTFTSIAFDTVTLSPGELVIPASQVKQWHSLGTVTWGPILPAPLPLPLPVINGPA